MAVTVSSIFRDSAGFTDRYFAQIAALEDALGESVRLIIAEGDSTDSTHNLLAHGLKDHEADDVLLKVDHGGPKFGTVDNPVRWAQIAFVCNAVMDAQVGDGPVIYVESDLMWEPVCMVQLLADLDDVSAVAPMSMTEGRFYDSWGHRGLDGHQFAFTPPYHQDLALSDADLIEISSAGSCIAMRPEIAKVARFGVNDCIVGLCREIRFHATLWLDRRVEVRHP